MARVRNNIFVRGLSGSVGDQFIIRKDRAGRTIISNAPTFDENRTFTESQQAQQERFKEAVVYAKDAKTQEIYQNKAAGTVHSPYNVAMADWFHEPEVKEIDMENWHGAIGDVIRIRAVDDVQVTQVTVLITDGSGVLLEQGAAVDVGSGWWTYTTQTEISGSPRVVAIARDLPGHVAQLEWQD